MKVSCECGYCKTKLSVFIHYYFVEYSDNATAVIIAKNEDNAREIAKRRNGVEIANIYELEPDTFNDEGYLIVSTRT